MISFYLCNILFLLSLVIFSEGNKAHETSQNEEQTIKMAEKKISEHVLAILEHYKQKDPIGIPGIPVPDPLAIPPFSHSFSIGTMDFKNVQVYGLSKFRVDHIIADLASMQVDAALTIDKLDVFGNYTLSTWLSRSNGPFNVKLNDVFIQAIARLEVEREGHLEAQEINMDMNFKNIAMNFERLGFFAGIFQTVMNSVGSFVFDSIKPFILNEVNINMRNDVNKQVKQLPQKFPNSISPFDQIVAEARRKVRNMGYDPYRVENYNNSIGLFEVEMSHTWLTGISSFHRVGNITFKLQNNTVQANMLIGTQKLKGSSHWDISLAGMISRAGTITFTVEYLQVQIIVSQNVDVRHSPKLDDIQIELGNIQVRFNGIGTIDYVIELAVNVLPNLLRYQIMDAIESPLKIRLQEILNTVNVEETINENLEMLDEEGNGLEKLLS